MMNLEVRQLQEKALDGYIELTLANQAPVLLATHTVPLIQLGRVPLCKGRLDRGPQRLTAFQRQVSPLRLATVMKAQQAVGTDSSFVRRQ
jgi:hypothetical protein